MGPELTEAIIAGIVFKGTTGNGGDTNLPDEFAGVRLRTVFELIRGQNSSWVKTSSGRMFVNNGE
jgi:hypothetical protein